MFLAQGAGFKGRVWRIGKEDGYYHSGFAVQRTECRNGKEHRTTT